MYCSSKQASKQVGLNLTGRPASIKRVRKGKWGGKDGELLFWQRRGGVEVFFFFWFFIIMVERDDFFPHSRVFFPFTTFFLPMNI